MTRATFDKGAKLHRIENNLDRPIRALRQIGVSMVAESQQAFRRQQFGQKRWQQRAPINVFGIIADFHAGRRKPPNRRFEASPALKDTGRLSSSIAWRLVGTSTVEVGTSLDYAAVHHRGGTTKSEPLTDKVRSRLWSWLKTQSQERRRRLGWLLQPGLRGQRLKQRVPERRIVGVTKRTRESIRAMIGSEIMEVR